MNNRQSFEVGTAAAMLVITVLATLVIIHLMPAVLQIVWQVAPSVLVLWFIAAVLRGMVQKLLG